MQTKLICVIFYTFSPSLSAPAHTSYPWHCHISTGQHPIISTLTKLRSTCPNHLNLPHLTTSAMLWTPKKLYKNSFLFLSFQDTPWPGESRAYDGEMDVCTHPSHHHMLCSLKAMQILSLHCLYLSPISQHTLDTSLKILSLHVIGCTTSCQVGR